MQSADRCLSPMALACLLALGMLPMAHAQPALPVVIGSSPPTGSSTDVRYTPVNAGGPLLYPRAPALADEHHLPTPALPMNRPPPPGRDTGTAPGDVPRNADAGGSDAKR